jgi:hypothetical protein
VEKTFHSSAVMNLLLSLIPTNQLELIMGIP